MIEFLREAGFRLTDKDDLQDGQFTLRSVEFVTGEYSTLKNVVLDRTENYILFLKDLRTDTMKTKLESVINSAMSSGVFVINNFSFNAEKVENGYNIELTFNIQG